MMPTQSSDPPNKNSPREGQRGGELRRVPRELNTNQAATIVALNKQSLNAQSAFAPPCPANQEMPHQQASVLIPQG